MTKRVLWISVALALLGSFVVTRLVQWRSQESPEVRLEVGAAATTPDETVLASVEATDPPGLRVDVTAARRPSRDIVEIRLALVNTDPSAPIPLGDTLAERSDEAGTLSAAFLTNDASTARHYVLRDSQGRPACTSGLDVLAPGERRQAWARFASPGPAARTVTLQLKGMPPLAGIELPPTP